VPWIGVVNATALGYVIRTVLTVAGPLLAAPERLATILGLAIAVAAYVLAVLLHRVGRFAVHCMHGRQTGSRLRDVHDRLRPGGCFAAITINPAFDHQG
jgi:hypothetical protein